MDEKRILALKHKILDLEHKWEFCDDRSKNERKLRDYQYELIELTPFVWRPKRK